MQEKGSKRNIMRQAKEKEGVKAKKLAEVKVQFKKMTSALKDKPKEPLSSHQTKKEEARAENLGAKDER
jgi:hypothetical protein